MQRIMTTNPSPAGAFAALISYFVCAKHLRPLVSGEAMIAPQEVHYLGPYREPPMERRISWRGGPASPRAKPSMMALSSQRPRVTISYHICGMSRYHTISQPTSPSSASA